MNILQGIQDSKQTFVVTLNHTHWIDPDKIIGRYTYAHPTFTLAGIEAQERWQEINTDKTWFCGAYWRNGFHEDGCWSAVRVARALGVDW
jgi:predicted NAD/FAD-binding protein